MPRPARLLLLFSCLAALWPARARAQTAPAPSPPPAARPAPLMPAQPSAPSVAAPSRDSVPPTIDPNRDQRRLAVQGSERPSAASATSMDGSIGDTPRDVYSEDWWGHPKPTFELHGTFRTRGELFHQFSLGRHNPPGDPQNLWPQPLDNSYQVGGQGTAVGSQVSVNLCGPNANQPCQDKTEATANLRFRLNPEIHISDNLRILSQIDLLDNLVLGSTPDAYAMKPGASTNGSGYVSAGYNGYAPLGIFSTTQGSPTAGVNGYQNSVNVGRVWGEYATPLGQLRFGRMPSQWGLGMVANAGDGMDSDYQTTIDRVMLVSGVKSLDLYFGAAWDFVSTGPTNASPFSLYGGQPYSTASMTNVSEAAAFIAHRTAPETQRQKLDQGSMVLNGGFYGLYRYQTLDVGETTAASQTPLTINTTNTNNGLQYRGAWEFIPDLWVQALYDKFRFEAELASYWGQIAQMPGVNAPASGNAQPLPLKIREFGLVTQTEYRAVEDKLRINFGFGWASGDPWAASLNPGSSLPSEGNTNGPLSTFAFHPDYRVDLIFFRQILTRVEGAYYFRPSVDYDFLRQPNGQKFGGGAAIIWSRASEFDQTPGHKRDLGIELDAQIYYQAKDGSLNDQPDKVGGFFAMLQYGVFFPLAGLNYLPGEQSTQLPNWDVSTAQTVRLFLGVLF